MDENQRSTAGRAPLPAEPPRPAPEILPAPQADHPVANGAAAAAAPQPPVQPTPVQPPPATPKPVVVDRASLPIKRIIMEDDDYIVFINYDGEIAWKTTQALDNELDTLGDAYSAVFNRFTEVKSMPVENLTDAQRSNFLFTIGQGLARLFEKHPPNATEMLNEAGAYATARNQEIARGWQLKATGITAGCFLVLGCLAWLVRGWLRPKVGDLPFILMIGACGGAVGALFSILTRLGTIALDPSAGPGLHKLEGGARIFAGAIGAVIAQLAVYLSLILGTLKDLGHPGLIFIAIIAGTSERLVPAIIKKTEGQAESEDKKKTESPPKSKDQPTP